MADTTSSALHIAIHDSGGVHLVEGWPAFGKEKLEFKCAGKVKTFAFSKDGKKFALIANGCVQVLNPSLWTVEHTLVHPTAQEIVWSPAGSYLAVWCLYIKKGDSGAPNLHIYDTREGCILLKSLYQISQVNWEPQWTGDDSIMGRNVTNEVHFFKCPVLDKIAHKRVQPKLKSFSLSPSTSGHHVAFFTSSVKGAPCIANVFKYPHLKENSRPLVAKSFYKVDSVEFMWNKQCNAVLLLTGADKGDADSYYGEKMVFLLNAKTEDAIRLTFDKDGPVNAVTWCPDGKSFLAVHGHNPASCSVFDAKGDLLHSLDEGARNMVMVNPVGNLAMVGGCGNISPRIEVWDLQKATRLCLQECPDVTFMQWSPCGRYLVTATCSPRLRVNNGYRIYHYSGSLQFEYLCPAGTELYKAQWVPTSTAAKPFPVSSAKVAGITSAVKTASSKPYVPPGQRAALSAGDQYVLTCKQFLRQIDKYDPNSPAAAANQAPVSKNAARNKKRKEAKKAKEEQAVAEKNLIVFEEPEAFVKKGKKKEEEAPVATVQLSGDADKKVKAIRKKLQRIEKLKKEKTEGKTLDKQQTALLGNEKDLVAQLKSLAI
ncbi:Translation initiation factor beta propellor-like domain [Trinorchestia longiramus]|nr:Translation initiation factor beta propellor-like domain [Trinorchestia longiramus]